MHRNPVCKSKKMTFFFEFMNVMYCRLFFISERVMCKTNKITRILGNLITSRCLFLIQNRGCLTRALQKLWRYMHILKLVWNLYLNKILYVNVTLYFYYLIFIYTCKMFFRLWFNINSYYEGMEIVLNLGKCICYKNNANKRFVI